MYNHELTLFGYEITKDEIGNEIPTPVKRKVLCRVADIGSSEFYNAQVTGLKPSAKFIIHEFEYAGEKEVMFEGKKYSVLRTYRVKHSIDAKKNRNVLDPEEVELTCERVIGHGS